MRVFENDDFARNRFFLKKTAWAVSYENGYRRFHAVCLCHHQLIDGSYDNAPGIFILYTCG